MKTQFLKLYSIFLITGMAANAQNRIALNDFNAINTSGATDIKLFSDSVNYISFDGAMEAINFSPEIQNNNLQLNLDKLKLSKTTVVNLHCKNLQKISASGSSDITAMNPFKVSELTIESNGASDISITLDADKINADVSGSGDLRLKGNCNLLTAKISGAGDLKAFDLKSKKVDVSISGAGDANVNVENSIAGKVSGAGSIKYSGKPSEIQIEQTGVGSVKRVDEGPMSIEIDKDGIKIETDTTRIKIGNRKIIILEDEEKKVESNEYPDPDRKNKKEKKVKVPKQEAKSIWSGVEFGVNGYLNNKNSLLIPKPYEGLELNYSKSFYWNINPFEKNIKLYKEYVSLTTGLGFEFNRYSFANRFQMVNVPDTLLSVNTGINYSKNVLRANYVTVPLFLEFNTSSNPKRSFHIAPGIVGAYKLGSARLKQHYTLDGVEHETISYGNYYVNPFKVSAALRVGYGKLNLSASYSLNELFSKNKTLGLAPFTIGLTLVSFD